MKLYQKLLYAGLCLCLLCGLCACEQEKEESSSRPESSQISSIAVSSEAEPESSRFVPAEDLIPDPPEEGDPFEDEFSQNPIDKKYDSDYSLASSFSMMRQACNEAARNWRGMVDTAFRTVLQSTPAEEKDALQAEQDRWEEELDGRIEAIRKEAGDGNEGELTAARAVVLLYRDRARELCKIEFDRSGKLPDFPDLDSAASAVG